MDLTLVLVDDHDIMREGLRGLLSREPGWQVIGEAADGRSGMQVVLELRPQVLITDHTMPELNGIDAVRQLREAGYTGGVVMLSMHHEAKFVRAAQAAGVDAYVLKDQAFAQVRAAVQSAARREPYLSPQIELPAHAEPAGPMGVDSLTPREREVLQLLAEGHSTKDVAFRLDLSPKTIETHRANLMAKLKIDNVAGLTRMAISEGLTPMWHRGMPSS